MLNHLPYKVFDYSAMKFDCVAVVPEGVSRGHINLLPFRSCFNSKLLLMHCSGTQGIAVTFVAQGEEDKLFKRMEENIGITIDELPGTKNVLTS